MVQLKLTLKSKRPSTVYSANGKSYRLLPGSNVLNLEYEDYLALAKSLSIKPVQKEEPVKEESREEDLVKEEIPEELHEEPVKEESHEEPVKEEIPEEQNEEIHEESIEEPHEESVKEEIPEESHSDNEYSSWSYSELKAEYKNITGKSCKLKKEEIIKFLQENKDNVE